MLKQTDILIYFTYEKSRYGCCVYLSLVHFAIKMLKTDLVMDGKLNVFVIEVPHI